MMQTGYGLPRFRVVKDKVTGLYKCHLCSYKSVYGSSLRSHFAVHSNARPYGCDMCSYEAKRLPDLKKHKILKHIRRNHSGTNALSNKNPLQVFRDPGSGLYRCQHCSYQSDNARCVRSHLAVHSHLRPYACDTCSYEAKRSSDLSKHKIIKHGRIPSRRNKSRKTPPEKTDTVVTGEDVAGSTQNTNNMAASSSARPDPQQLQQELDRCDVLSDLDYSMMSPTRAALEALRRCNMEPLDMFNEYSNHDSFQHNPVFPEPEMSNYNKRQYQNDQVHVAEENRGNNVNYGIQGAYVQGHQQNHNETTVFIKPEPPDDYFELMRCQNKVVVQNENCSPKQEVEVVICKSSPGNKPSQDTTTGANQCSSTPGSKDSGSNNGSETSTDQPGADPDRPRSTQSSGSESHCSDKILNHLERRNVSGSSLIRPVMPNPRPPPEVDRASIECSQSRESGYSSPGNSTPVIQPLGLKVELEHHGLGGNSKATNTRKSWSCHHCDIMFFDGALYFMHMGLHNGEDPWRCNMCCTKFYDVYGFTSHFVNGH